jgi:hypothetical protein
MDKQTTERWIATATGGRVWFDPIDVSEVRLRDIALGAARETRFNGQYQQTIPFYSVAEHCTLGSYIAPMGSRGAFHVHDAAEAFLKDITKPLKVLLPDYTDIETHFEEALRRKFHWPDWHTAEVKRVDMAMLVAERTAMMNHRDRTWAQCGDVEAANVTFNYWLPTMAWVAWEDRYKELAARGELPRL